MCASVVQMVGEDEGRFEDAEDEEEPTADGPRQQQ